MPIVPDTKDWTWVLERTCSECDFDVRSFPRDEIGSMIRDAAERWREVLARPRVGARPREDVWSPLEYGCHVRDVFDVYRERLQLMIEEDDPEFPNWDQDSTAIEQLYAEQDPHRVAAELGAAAEALAASFDSVEEDQWQRTGRRDDGANFTVESLARYMIHDPNHHLHDAGNRSDA
jgi:hypothetical protein